MNHRLSLAILLPVALAACGKQPAATEQHTSGAMPNMTPPQTATRATGAGTITAIDPAAGTVTIAHGPVAALNWPAMTMSFSGTPDQLKGAATGDTVAFAFDWNGKAGTLVSLEKR